jgi:hypothetical protein
MAMVKTVDVPRDSFRFCRWSLAVLMWWGVLNQAVFPIVVCWLVMLASALLTVQYAPLMVLWTLTVHRVKPSPPEALDVGAMRFAHSLATVLIGLPLLLLATGTPAAGALAWRILTVVAVFKTVAAISGCPASKMYSCVRGGGTCCAWLRRND